MIENKEYIKQCAAAKELQEAWEPRIGDRFVMYVQKKSALSPKYLEGTVGPQSTRIYRKQSNYIWLLTQEQLWAMLQKTEIITVMKSPHKNGIRWKGVTPSVFLIDRDLESLLLRLVYEINYNKTWNFKKGTWV